MVHISTPYDDLIIQLNTKLNTTYIGYGDLGRSKKENQHTQDMNAELLEEVVVVKRAVSKSSRLYNNKSWDLVDASNEEDFDIESVEKEHLPNELKEKSNKEIETYLDQKRKERVEIQKEIIALNQKREAYIAEKTHEETGELENALLSAIVKQAAKKNYRWE